MPINCRIFNEAKVEFLWDLLHSWAPKWEITRNLNNIKLKLEKVIGIGATSTVHLAKEIKTGELVAFKVSDSCLIEHEAAILKKFETIPTKISPKIITYSPEYMAIAFELCKSVVPSRWTPPEQMINGSLTIAHFDQLFKKMVLMHDAGVVHRDIRKENIVVSMDESEAFFIDFAFALSDDEPAYYAGTMVTASFRVLTLLSEGHNQFQFKARDDLESFVKCFYLHRTGCKLPPLKGNLKLDAKAMLDFWSKVIGSSWIASIQEYDALKAFIGNFLASEATQPEPTAVLTNEGFATIQVTGHNDNYVERKK